MKSIKLLFLFGLITVVGVSCTEGPDFKTSYTATFQRNALIKADTIHRKIAPDSMKVLYKLSISTGNNYVFRYKKSTVPTKKDILDGASVHTLIFQVPDSIKKFSYSGHELTAAHAFYQLVAIGPPRVYKVQKGVLEGRKTSDGNWKIHADLTAAAFPRAAIRVQFDKTFHYKKYPYENR